MNKKIHELALDAHLINYIDNETPRRYFVSGNADVEDVQRFAELILRECANVAAEHDALDIYEEIREHFGVEL